MHLLTPQTLQVGRDHKRRVHKADGDTPHADGTDQYSLLTASHNISHSTRHRTNHSTTQH
jgi:hypothetical protein